jgi:hypothetical protein
MNNGNRRSIICFPQHFGTFNMWKTKLCTIVSYEVHLNYANVIEIASMTYITERDKFFAHPRLIDNSSCHCHSVLKVQRQDIVDACPDYAQRMLEDDANVVNLNIYSKSTREPTTLEEKAVGFTVEYMKEYDEMFVPICDTDTASFVVVVTLMHKPTIMSYSYFN